MATSSGNSGGPSGIRSTSRSSSSRTPVPARADTGTISSKSPSFDAASSCGTAAWCFSASILFTAQNLGPSNGATCCAYTYASPRPTPAAASTSCTIASTPSTDVDTVWFSRCPKRVLGLWNPGVSTNTTCDSGVVTTPRTPRRVVWGLSETIATF